MNHPPVWPWYEISTGSRHQQPQNNPKICFAKTRAFVSVSAHVKQSRLLCLEPLSACIALEHFQVRPARSGLKASAGGQSSPFKNLWCEIIRRASVECGELSLKKNGSRMLFLLDNYKASLEKRGEKMKEGKKKKKRGPKWMSKLLERWLCCPESACHPCWVRLPGILELHNVHDVSQELDT